MIDGPVPEVVAGEHSTGLRKTTIKHMEIDRRWTLNNFLLFMVVDVLTDKVKKRHKISLCHIHHIVPFGGNYFNMTEYLEMTA